MLHCVVVALSASFTGLRAPLRSPHVHGRLATRPVLHQRAAAAVGAPAVGDVQATEAVGCRASAMAAQPKESEPVAPAAHELCCDNRGPVQASRVILWCQSRAPTHTHTHTVPTRPAPTATRLFVCGLLCYTTPYLCETISSFRVPLINNLMHNHSTLAATPKRRGV